MAVSEAPPSIKSDRSINQLTSAEIASSQNDQNNNQQLIAGSQLREKRRVLSVITSTLTTTSYSFVTSTVAKTYSLVATTGNLVCVPVGYTVC
jgi:hypothetical protein